MPDRFEIAALEHYLTRHLEGSAGPSTIRQLEECVGEDRASLGIPSEYAYMAAYCRRWTSS